MLGTCTPQVANSAPATKNCARNAWIAARSVRDGSLGVGMPASKAAMLLSPASRQVGPGRRRRSYGAAPAAR